jgi:hypothetical protein
MDERFLQQDNHWTTAPYPLRPCDEEVEIYKSHLLSGKTLLLGCTPALLPLCDEALDLVIRVPEGKFEEFICNI